MKTINSFIITQIIAILLFGFYFTAAAQPNPVVDSYEKLERKRISRTVYEYTYKVTIINTGDDAEGLRGTLSVNTQSIEVVDSEVTFGNVLAGGNAKSTDTFRIRIDRRYSIDTDDLIWNFKFLPPDPGDAGKETLLGIDSDSDGVRDDIQRYIYFTYPDEKKVRLSLTQIARNYQILLPDSSDPEISHENVKTLIRSRACLSYIKDDNIREAIKIRKMMKAEILDTQERSLKYLEFNNSLAGKTSTLPKFEEHKDCCLFDADNTGDNQ